MRLGAGLASCGGLLLTLTTVGCGDPPPPPNVVVILVDTLRADALTGSGGTDEATPEIARLAGAGMRFTRTVSQASWTVPSLASLMTSRYPGEHGQGAQTVGEPPKLVTLAEMLHAHGYSTAAFAEVENELLIRGFDTYQMPAGVAKSRYLAAALDRPTPTFARAIDWLRKPQPRPFFLYVHSYGVHDYFLGKPRHRARALRAQPGYAGPLLGWHPRPPAEAVGNMIIGAMLRADAHDLRFARDLYGAGVTEVDSEVGQLLAVLDEQGLTEQTVVVLTSDHGEGFDPRRHRLHHGARLHEDVLHVPLIVRWTERIVPGSCRSRVQLVDVAPTLLQLTGLPIPAELRGRPLFRERSRWFRRSVYEVSAGERPALAEESAQRVLPSGLRELSSIRQLAFYRGELKLVRTGADEALYDLATDPLEDTDLRRARPGLAAEMRSELEKLGPLVGEPATTLRPDVVDALRSLGYIQ